MKTFLWLVQAFGPFTGILAGYHQEQEKRKSNQTRRAAVAHVGSVTSTGRRVSCDDDVILVCSLCFIGAQA